MEVVVENQTYTTMLTISNFDENTYIYSNCTFTNAVGQSGIKITGTSRVIIDGCSFENIDGNGIWINPSAIAQGITIYNNYFHNIGGNGINTNTKCKDIIIESNYMDTIATYIANADALHGIYMQSPGYKIINNTIKNIIRADGNGISVRASGLVQDNQISNCTKNGITYYSDQLAIGDLLTIQGNMCINCENNPIGIQSNGQLENIVKHVNIFTNELHSEINTAISISGSSNINTSIFNISENRIFTNNIDEFIYNPYAASVLNVNNDLYEY